MIEAGNFNHRPERRVIDNDGCPPIFGGNDNDLVVASLRSQLIKQTFVNMARMKKRAHVYQSLAGRRHLKNPSSGVGWNAARRAASGSLAVAKKQLEMLSRAAGTMGN